jgi:Leucine-rich repeat (LRR) protein
MKWKNNDLIKWIYNEYNQHTKPITKWTHDDLTEWINDGCDQNVANFIVELHCFYCQLTNSQFMFESPKISLLINLQTLDCGCNQLKSLPPEICQLINLQTLCCSGNYLTCLPLEIGQLINLRQLYCSQNRLTSLSFDDNRLISLHIFDCSENKLTKLPSEIGQLINLQRFDCSCNELTSLPSEIGQLINLQIFYCGYNELTSLPPETSQLINLQTFLFFNNEIEYIPPNVQRFLNRLRNTYKKKQGIYNDTQSVHDHNIQECIRKSINYVMSQKPILNNEQLTETITENEILNKTTKQLLFEYMEDTNIHSIIGVTFHELLSNVFSLIFNHAHKNEILNILNIEIQESECKCFTGRMSRLVNCLNGFDENVQIKIADNEQIANIILQIKNKHEDIETIKAEVNTRLIELGYESETIDSWMEYIDI